ncbi:hypothetical protein DFJ73DRAFT_799705 [Zopfochytrium polystomum]|nr:hypothetical protein DFJ73DRAFT_799705 [Zopfochytrium polystomum]
MPASVGCLGLPLEVLLQVLRLCICNGSDAPASTADRKQLLQDRQRQSLRPRGSQITGENRRGHRDQREDDTWRHPMLRYAIRSEEHCLAFLSARYLVALSAVSRAFRGLLSPPSSHGRALWRAAFDALVRPLTVGVSRSGPAMSASAVSDRAVLEILFSHAAWAIAPDIVQRSHFNPWDDDHVSDALRGGPAAMMALWCWLRANPSSFDTKKELLVHALAVGYRPAARLLVSPVGNTLLSFRYGAGTPRTSCRKPVRRDRSIHARGRVGMTLLQAVVYRGARLCSVPAAVPPPPDPKDSHRNEFYRLHNKRNFVLEPSLPTSPWEFALADAVSFVLDADPREAAAVVNEQSCGGKTALDIAYELYSYWQRSGPWSETSFGVPGSGRHQKALKLARARTLERTIEVLRFHGGRSAIEGRDLLMFVRDLDVEGVKKELSLAVTAADSQNGMLASTGIFSARNFRINGHIALQQQELAAVAALQKVLNVAAVDLAAVAQAKANLLTVFNSAVIVRMNQQKFVQSDNAAVTGLAMLAQTQDQATLAAAISSCALVNNAQPQCSPQVMALAQGILNNIAIQTGAATGGAGRGSICVHSRWKGVCPVCRRLRAAGWWWGSYCGVFDRIGDRKPVLDQGVAGTLPAGFALVA